MKKSRNELKRKSKKIHTEFAKEMKKKIPCTSIGIITKKDGSPKFLEVIVRRPERYSCPQIIKNIPKKYKGVNVKVF